MDLSTLSKITKIVDLETTYNRVGLFKNRSKHEEK
jgi:hypothetical protein